MTRTTAMTETRYQRVAREQRERQEARIKRSKERHRAASIAGHANRRRQGDEARRRNADHIDGFDRDDLGESPDY
jgi:hypothetical protein